MASIRTRARPAGFHCSRRCSSTRCNALASRAMAQAPPTEPLHRALGLTDEEYDRVRSTLGRDPNRAELAMYSVMWSEHCSYKSSRAHLRALPTEGAAVLVGPGEDAGVVDLGDGL